MDLQLNCTAARQSVVDQSAQNEGSLPQAWAVAIGLRQSFVVRAGPGTIQNGLGGNVWETTEFGCGKKPLQLHCGDHCRVLAL
ncbi:hypothetical protein Pan14r_26280 [Crateriforma conspicua]|uniref:Uncharacterized protein n=1 Tax=Crateriforma conspicua TaxID=2527996 RepID=A0A5C5Y6F7_9PLAN|nr:hypothetical protein Mal65_40930 [Crateriforma conspicua]TWT70323.1 hypothetical protein Pan14r_26280 [Crateriforma conspicua]